MRWVFDACRSRVRAQTTISCTSKKKKLQWANFEIQIWKLIGTVYVRVSSQLHFSSNQHPNTFWVTATALLDNDLWDETTVSDSATSTTTHSTRRVYFIVRSSQKTDWMISTVRLLLCLGIVSAAKLNFWALSSWRKKNITRATSTNSLNDCNILWRDGHLLQVLD